MCRSLYETAAPETTICLRTIIEKTHVGERARRAGSVLCIMLDPQFTPHSLTELCKLRSLPDKDAPNPDAGIDALRELKRVAVEHDLVMADERTRAGDRKAIATEKARIVAERQALLARLREDFVKAVSTSNRQSAGYSLEDILEQLFPVFEIEYRKSFRTETQQIDGYFRFEGFDYLVEAKWRADQPPEQEIGGFKRKVDTKLESTRGVFLSIPGFRDEVVRQFSGERSNILFMTGQDLMYVLEGRVDLRDVLRTKIEKAAQEGRVLMPVSSILS